MVGGGSSLDYMRTISPDTFVMMCEEPYFYCPDSNDLTLCENLTRKRCIEKGTKPSNRLALLAGTSNSFGCASICASCAFSSSSFGSAYMASACIYIVVGKRSENLYGWRRFFLGLYANDLTTNIHRQNWHCAANIQNPGAILPSVS